MDGSARQLLVVLGGFAGGGKTTVALRLAKELRMPIFSSDDLNAGLRPLLKRDFHEASPVAYGLLWYLLNNHVGVGSAILDTNMCNDRSWTNLDILAANHPNLQVMPILLECRLDLHRERIEERGRSNQKHLNLGGDSFDNVLEKFRYISQLRRPDLIRVDANGGPDEVYGAVYELVAPYFSC